jgi:cytochrome P450
MTIFTDEHRRDPYRTYAALPPLVRLPAGWLVLDHAGVRRVLTEQETFSSAVAPPGSAPGRWLIFSDPPRHGRLRALVTRAFTSSSVAGLEPRVAALAARLLDDVVTRGAMDLVGELAVPLPLQVIASLLGAPAEDWPLFRRWSDAILTLAASVLGEAGVADVAAVTEEMARYLEDLLAARRRVGRDDLLTRLVAAEVDGERLGDDDILGFFQLLLIAGHETTTNLIANAVLCLLEHPDEAARSIMTPSRWPAVIEEVLRYRSPVQAVFRVTRRDVTLHGQLIPAGALVLPVIGAANRDAAAFGADADRFIVGRDRNPHLAFGHGIHFSVGAPLSRLEARVALPMIFDRLRDLRRAEDGPWQPRPAFHVLGPARLPVAFR